MWISFDSISRNEFIKWAEESGLRCQEFDQPIPASDPNDYDILLTSMATNVAYIATDEARTLVRLSFNLSEEDYMNRVASLER